MAPYCDVNVEDVEPMSRTYQYRKVMKPLLERKRRARINRCLDQLKDLMVGALQKDGDSITKLEKADVLELTVNHLKKLKHHNALAIPARSHSQEKFNSGFRQCASEVSKFIKSAPGIDVQVSNSLLGHLGGVINHLDELACSIQNSSVQQSSTYSTTNTSSTTPVTVSIPSKMYTPPASPDHTLHQPRPSAAQTGVSSVSRSAESSFVPVHPQASLHPSFRPSNDCSYKLNSYSQRHRVSPLAPPSPPLSVGSPSPVHHFNSRPSSSSSSVEYPASSPKSTSLSLGLLSSCQHPEITDGPIWRPW
ncbi:hypothetical protein HAZT_HAZT007028 [Hyalella azteca]|uniref:Enhancer of split mbeta protein n=1 Tax=Hyalella azteca TaxID=294128 RepID=A0A6A0GRG6_HYAAZ|nr:enhancer of split mbeta protein [Hyalella azteca]KAA0183598.1 hypothetical protein HAZT_HAZT007028 [Hyalella azteca]